MNTAEKLKDIFGSWEKLGLAAGRTKSTAWKWSQNYKGRIPQDAMVNIYKYAKRRKIELNLTMEDLV